MKRVLPLLRRRALALGERRVLVCFTPFTPFAPVLLPLLVLCSVLGVVLQRCRDAETRDAEMQRHEMQRYETWTVIRVVM